MKTQKQRFLYLLSMIIASFTLYNQPVSAQSSSHHDSSSLNTSSVIVANKVNPELHHARDKKLIQTGLHLQWSYVKDHIEEMEARHPALDGVASSMNGRFDQDYLMLRGDKHWTEEDVQINTVSQINWGRYTENFIVLYFGDEYDFEFFNDDKWSTIIYNAQMVSKMVEAGRFRGVFLDDENYYEPSHGWQYKPEWFPNHTFEEVRAKCRERGAAFMKALDSYVSDPIVLLDFLWFGDYWNDYDSNTGRQVLWLAFKDGMIEAAKEEDVFVEGNECAYYYQETAMFTDIVNEFRQNKFPKYGASDLQDKYKAKVQIGHGIYPNLYYGGFRWPYKPSPEEQDKWWKHQLYHSLLTSDQYVWIWSPNWDWWGEGGKPLTENFVSIMNEVKDKIRNQEELDYDMVKYGPNWVGNLVTPEEKFHIAAKPVITITSPSQNFATGGNLSIETKVSDDVNKVEFYLNSMRIGIVNADPFTLDITGLTKGTYTLFARAFNSNKEHTTSAPVIFVVGDS